MELSIVIPIYRCARNALHALPEVIRALQQNFTEYEIIFIIDNPIIEPEVKDLYSLEKNYPQVKIHALNKNHGQHFATLCGYYLAKGDFILSIDEDMTKYLPEICRSGAYKSFDVFYWFYNKNNMYTSVVRKIFSILFKALIHRIVNFKKNSTFRVISRPLRDKLLADKHIFWNIDVMIFNNTNSIGGYTLKDFDVKDDNSSYNYKSLINIAFEIAYEHNTIFMNLLLALFPALLVFLVTRNAAATSITYILLVLLITAIVSGIRKTTLPTREKIERALAQEIISPCT